MFYQICVYFLWFLLYSFFGWLCEVIACSIQEKRLILNRGFLIGPYCPIYGTGSLIMILFLGKYVEDPVALFIMSLFFCTILEYLTSWAMEKLFHARWWDYSEKKFNINGRVCLWVSSLFGLLGLLLMYLVHPAVTNVLHFLPAPLLITLAILLFLLFLTDVVLSTVVVTQIRKNNLLLKEKDVTESISQQVKEILSKNYFFKRRLLHAFPKAFSIDGTEILAKLRSIVDDAKDKKKKSKKNKNDLS